MTRHRVIVDIEFTIDEDRFKLAQLTDDAAGISDATDPAVREAITRLLVRAGWAENGLAPLRSIVNTAQITPEHNYEDAPA